MFLLAQDVLELAGGADGEQECPGQQGVRVELGCLGAHGGTSAILSDIGPGEQALEALHGGVNVLQKAEAKIVHRMLRRITPKPSLLSHRNERGTESNQGLTKMSSSATKVQRPRLVATYHINRNRICTFSEMQPMKF